jgi:membrane protein
MNERLKGYLQAFYYSIKDAGKLYIQKDGPTISSSVCFYFLMSFLPSFVLVLSVAMIFLGELNNLESELFTFIKEFFPHLPVWVEKGLKEIIKSQQSKQHHVSWFSLIFIIWGALGVLRGTFHGIHLLTGSGHQKQTSVNLRSLVVLLLSVLALFLLLFLTPFSLYVLKWFEVLINLIAEKGIGRSFFGGVVDANVLKSFSHHVLQSNLLHGFIIVSFFTFLFKFLFTKELSFKSSLFGSVVFVLLFISGKFGYWLYLDYSKQTLVKNYGQFYTLIVSILWVYFLVNSFFFSACVSHCSSQQKH